MGVTLFFLLFSLLSYYIYIHTELLIIFTPTLENPASATDCCWFRLWPRRL